MRRMYLVAMVLSFVMMACQEQSDSISTVNVMLTDASADYKAVWIDIQSVEVNFTSDSIDGQWITLDGFRSGFYNLLEYSNGNDTLLGSANVPNGTISQIRLILGDQNSVVTESDSCELKVPSGSTSGLKINLHEILEEGITKNIWLDFVVSKSIVKSGNGKYHLKPVIRAYTESTSGAIKGTVDPKESLPNVFAILNTDTLTTKADTNGYFFFGGVPSGTYSVKFEPVVPYLDLTLDGIQVVNGVYTDLDTVHISQ